MSLSVTVPCANDKCGNLSSPVSTGTPKVVVDVCSPCHQCRQSSKVGATERGRNYHAARLAPTLSPHQCYRQPGAKGGSIHCQHCHHHEHLAINHDAHLVNIAKTEIFPSSFIARWTNNLAPLPRDGRTRDPHELNHERLGRVLPPLEQLVLARRARKDILLRN